ncbi:MAG TPA: AMP-binding protein [Steroidobacteraceae bacterium]|nr:AMP-binding protein [Steroidobacteraceae bacterium]
MDAPLVHSATPSRPILFANGRAVSVGELLASVRRVAAALGEGGPIVNLCEHRDRFLIVYCAALVRGRMNLLPPSRAPLIIEEVAANYAGSVRCDDALVARALGEAAGAAPVDAGGGAAGLAACGAAADRAAADRAAAERAAADVPRIPCEAIAEIAFTSGSTGAPKAHVKRWRTLLGSTVHNAARIHECLAPAFGAQRPWIVATVPPQHMYGTETSILLPLAADMAVHAARPLFPADVAAALAEVPGPRVLIATPVHLRALVDSDECFPQVHVVVSATAPLERPLAAAAERVFGGVVLEMFGSTETCVIATRRTAHEASWHLYPGVALEPGGDGTVVRARWFDGPVVLQDIVELDGDRRFIVRGRNADMIEVAGKRASLADLNRRLLAISGVRDAVAFQPDEATGVVRRVAALVVAPGLAPEAILAELGRAVDPAFLPRPLVLVPALPRNELGKLSREALMRLVAERLPHQA